MHVYARITVHLCASVCWYTCRCSHHLANGGTRQRNITQLGLASFRTDLLINTYLFLPPIAHHSLLLYTRDACVSCGCDDDWPFQPATNKI